MLSGLGGMVAQGMAWGTGTAIAREAVGAVLHGGSGSGNQQQHEQAAAQQQQQLSPQEPCFSQQKSFMDCLEANNGAMEACAF